MNSLRLQNSDTLTPSIAPAEVLVQYAETGVIDRDIAVHLTKQSFEDRLSFVKSAEQLLDALENDEKARLNWLVRSLSKEAIDEIVIIETVSSIPVVEPKYGLGERAFTDGRHSSSETFGSYKRT